MQNIFYILMALVLCLFASNPAVALDEYIKIGTFTPAEMKLWEEESFEGHTKYKSIIEGAAKDNNYALRASCDGTASAFYRDKKIDLRRTPILKWSWKIDNIHHGLDDVSKGGDDYAARVYVIYKHGIMPWSVKALNYVWANSQAKNTSWDNAFTSKARMIAQQSGQPMDKDLWVEESRNVAQDFKDYFDIDVNKINGIAIMTDCDNAKGKATSYYKNIRFTAE